MSSSPPTRYRPFAATLLLILVFVAVCLPTGSILGVNVKAILFAVYALAFVIFIVDRTEGWPTFSEQVFLCALIICLGYWAVVGLVRDEAKLTEVFLQMKDISSTIVIAWSCAFFLRRRLLSPESVIKSVVYGEAAVGIFKIGLIAAFLVWHLNPIQLVETVFGEASLLGAEIGLGLTRLGFSSDIAGGFSMFAILCPSVSGVRLRRRYVAFIMLMLVVSGLLSYARYIWFIDLFAVFAALMIEKRFKTLLLSLVTLAVLAGAFYDTLTPLVVARFSSGETSESDLTRIEQSKALWEEIQSRPLFGKGIGQHAEGSIRSEQNRYSYELQWLALLMQVGIVGMAAILLLVLAAARDLLAIHGPAKPWLVAMYILWLGGSWTNPYLTSSFAGATFGMFIAMFYRARVMAVRRGLASSVAPAIAPNQGTAPA